ALSDWVHHKEKYQRSGGDRGANCEGRLHSSGDNELGSEGGEFAHQRRDPLVLGRKVTIFDLQIAGLNPAALAQSFKPILFRLRTWFVPRQNADAMDPLLRAGLPRE